MVDSLRLFAAEVTRVAKEVGTDGQLGGQAYVYVLAEPVDTARRSVLTCLAATVSTYRENGNRWSTLSTKCVET